MKMELIQPFINAADAVFAEAFQAPTTIVDLTMEEETYRRKGVAALILVRGEIEGRVILDLAPDVAIRVASHQAGAPVPESDEIVRETVCELANMVIGNSVTLLNDQGFRFKTLPPEIHSKDEGLAGSRDTEAMVLCVRTSCGEIYLNIAMHYSRRQEREALPVAE
jgi:CheY-specific phosphatase CheX